MKSKERKKERENQIFLLMMRARSSSSSCEMQFLSPSFLPYKNKAVVVKRVNADKKIFLGKNKSTMKLFKTWVAFSLCAAKARLENAGGGACSAQLPQ